MSAGDHLKELGGNLRPGQAWCIRVTDETENTLFEIQVKPNANVQID
jgi:hypothetical protein